MCQAWFSQDGKEAWVSPSPGCLLLPDLPDGTGAFQQHGGIQSLPIRGGFVPGPLGDTNRNPAGHGASISRSPLSPLSLPAGETDAQGVFRRCTLLGAMPNCSYSLLQLLPIPLTTHPTDTAPFPLRFWRSAPHRSHRAASGGRRPAPKKSPGCEGPTVPPVRPPVARPSFFHRQHPHFQRLVPPLLPCGQAVNPSSAPWPIPPVFPFPLSHAGGHSGAGRSGKKPPTGRSSVSRCFFPKKGPLLFFLHRFKICNHIIHPPFFSLYFMFREGPLCLVQKRAAFL